MSRAPAPSLLPPLLSFLLASGGAAGGETIDLQFAPRLVLEGERAGDWFGTALAAGDFDGDGIEDLAVGSPTADGASGEAAAGRIYLYFGGPSRTTEPEPGAAPPAPDAVLAGSIAHWGLGDRLAAGDIDGDGRADLVIGSWQGDGPAGDRAGCGEAAIFLGRGRDRFAPLLRFGPGEADLTIFGAEPNDHLGGEMAVGDFDGDGFDDVALGAFYGDGPAEDRHHAGEVALFFGEAAMKSASPRTIDLAEERLPTVYGREAVDTFGRAIAAGDVDGDGRDDLLVGAYYADGPANDRINCGEAYIVFGAVRDRFAGGIDLSIDMPIILYGARDGDVTGRSVGAADLNGDGVDDLLVGAHLAAADPAAPPEGNEGVVYLLYGRSRHDWAAEIDLRIDADARLSGRTDGDQLSWPVRGVRSGERRPLALVSSRGSEGGEVGRSNAGEVFVLGGPGGTPLPASGSAAEAALLSLVGLDAEDRLGADAVVFDWNADGRPEIAIGAPDAAGALNQKPRCGEVVLHTLR